MTQSADLKTAPGPRGHFLLGHLLAFRRDAIGLLMDSSQQFGDVVRLRLGPHVIHLVNDPEHAEQVLVTNQQNYDRATRSASSIKRVCRDSLLTTSGSFWKRERRLVQPIFHNNRMATFATLMTDVAAETMERWNGFAEERQTFDIASEMSRLTYAIVGRTLFSSEVAGGAAAVERAFGILLDETFRRLERVINLPLNFPSRANLRFKAALQQIDNVVYEILAERRRQPDRQHDLLSLLLQARDEESGACLSDEQLRNEIITLLLAGHETTANALAWTFYLLSNFPDAEARVANEAAEVLGQRTPCVDDLAKLKYTTQVLHESLRLYPPIWIIERHAIAEDNIGGFRIPEESMVVICPYALHRHPRFWPAPERFEPERFAEAPDAMRKHPAFLPFGAGPHHCIGAYFAMLEARLVLAMVAQRFRLRLWPGQRVEPKPGITLRPRHGIMMTVERR